MIRLERHERGPRLYLIGRRCHHGIGFAALALAALVAGRRRLALALGAYAATDWRDFPFTDRCNH